MGTLKRYKPKNKNIVKLKNYIKKKEKERNGK
jgi:hypothetical protein